MTHFKDIGTRCGACGHVSPAGATSCSDCGAPLPVQAKQERPLTATNRVARVVDTWLYAQLSTATAGVLMQRIKDEIEGAEAEYMGLLLKIQTALLPLVPYQVQGYGAVELAEAAARLVIDGKERERILSQNYNRQQGSYRELEALYNSVVEEKQGAEALVQTFYNELVGTYLSESAFEQWDRLRAAYPQLEAERVKSQDERI